MKTYETFQDVMLNDPTVNRIMKSGGTESACVVELANEKQRLMARIIELDSIAPKKYKTPDGRVMVWNCPEDLVPVTEIPKIP